MVRVPAKEVPDAKTFQEITEGVVQAESASDAPAPSIATQVNDPALARTLAGDVGEGAQTEGPVAGQPLSGAQERARDLAQTMLQTGGQGSGAGLIPAPDAALQGPAPVIDQSTVRGSLNPGVVDVAQTHLSIAPSAIPLSLSVDDFSDSDVSLTATEKFLLVSAIITAQSQARAASYGYASRRAGSLNPHALTQEEVALDVQVTAYTTILERLMPSRGQPQTEG